MYIFVGQCWRSELVKYFSSNSNHPRSGEWKWEIYVGFQFRKSLEKRTLHISR